MLDHVISITDSVIIIIVTTILITIGFIRICEAITGSKYVENPMGGEWTTDLNTLSEATESNAAARCVDRLLTTQYHPQRVPWIARAHQKLVTDHKTDYNKILGEDLTKQKLIDMLKNESLLNPVLSRIQTLFQSACNA